MPPCDGSESETYDAEGNRTTTGDSTGTGNELQSDGTWNYSYDAAGNETYKVAISGGETWEYGYDNKNELVKAQLWASDPRVYGTGDTLLEEVDYKYDAWGNLVETDSYPTGSGSPNVTRYAVDGWNPALAGTTGNTRFNVWADLNRSNGLVTRYFHGDQPDQLFARQDAGVQYWYLTDYQGSVRDVLDNSGNVKDAITYDGLGNIISETNSTYRGSYAWTGRLLDVEIGLQYNRARWYDPTTGRWQSQDPLGFDAGDSNLYRYVNNAPTDATDPSGLRWVYTGGHRPADVVLGLRWDLVSGYTTASGLRAQPYWRRDVNGKYVDYTFVAPPHPLPGYRYVLDPIQPSHGRAFFVSANPPRVSVYNEALEQRWVDDDPPQPRPAPIPVPRPQFDEPGLISDPIPLIGTAVVGTCLIAEKGTEAVGAGLVWLGKSVWKAITSPSQPSRYGPVPIGR